MSKVIAAVFEQPSNAAASMDQLAAKGVAESRISVLATDPVAEESLGIRKNTKGAEGVAAGAGIGAVSAGIFAGLTSVGVLATGGAGLLVAGPVAAALAGAGAGAVGGGVLGGLIGLGFSEHEVKHFDEALGEGAVVVAVDMKDCDDEDVVNDVFKNQEAKDISRVSP